MQLMSLSDSGFSSDIEVHCLGLQLGESDEAVAHLLTKQEREKARRFMRLSDRARFAQTRAAVRMLLARRLACRPGEISLQIDARGKPFVDAGSGEAPLFNVSHSGAYALIAIAKTAAVTHVGVDIEQRREDIDVHPFLEFAFASAERDEVLASGDPVKAFYTRWVGKEAVLKAIGVGIVEDLRRVRVHPRLDVSHCIDTDVPAWSGFQVRSLAAPDRYAAALAWCYREKT